MAQSTTQSQQKLTISAGVACLSAGDTLFIHGGWYTGAANAINPYMNYVSGGTNFGSGAITIAAYPGEVVTLAPGTGANVITLTSAEHSYLIFDRLILDAAGMDGGSR